MFEMALIYDRPDMCIMTLIVSSDQVNLVGSIVSLPNCTFSTMDLYTVSIQFIAVFNKAGVRN